MSRLNTKTSPHLCTWTSEHSGSTWIVFVWYIESFEASQILEKGHLYLYAWGSTKSAHGVCTDRIEGTWVDIFQMKGDTLHPTLTTSSYYIFQASELKKSGDCWVPSWYSRLVVTPYAIVNFSFGCSWILMSGYIQDQKWYGTPVTFGTIKWYIGSFGADEIGWLFGVFPGRASFPLRNTSSSIGGYLQGKNWYGTPITLAIFKRYIGSFGAEEIGWFGVFPTEPTFHYAIYHC